MRSVTPRATWWWALQAALVILVLGLVGRTLARHWTEFQSVQFPLHPHVGWIGLAVVVVLATYAVLIAAWKVVVTGWGGRLAYPAAVRIWTVSNLGRYLPGKVWSVAGLAVLATREGVPGWAAVAAAVAMQAVAVGSGVAVAAAAVPGTLSAVGLTAAAGVATMTIAVLATPSAVALIARVMRRDDLRALPVRVVALSGAAMTVSWVGYGLAFWCLARGTIGPTALRLDAATGVFAAGYLAGLLALFAPGGVGVRELVLIPLLTPSTGPGGAILLAVASRILLTVTEAIAALTGVAIGARSAAPEAPEHD